MNAALRKSLFNFPLLVGHHHKQDNEVDATYVLDLFANDPSLEQWSLITSSNDFTHKG